MAPLASVRETLVVREEVADAMSDGRPVVALESTLVTHGFAYPRNLEAAQRAEQAVRAAGAVPATIAVSEGRLRVGLSAEELESLAGPGESAGADPAAAGAGAAAATAAKASRQNLAAVLTGGGRAGTTVSATMIVAHLAGIQMFATGGIGGVHRDGARTLDISADLEELARTPVAVVSAGPKSILDVGLTLEYLETRGVPVVSWGTSELAGFLSRSSGYPAPSRVDDARHAAALIRTHWGLGLRTGLVFAVPLSSDIALPEEEVEAAIDRALAEAEALGIHGRSSTPHLLARLAELTSGASVEPNVRLIEANARVAAQIAAALLQET